MRRLAFAALFLCGCGDSYWGLYNQEQSHSVITTDTDGIVRVQFEISVPMDAGNGQKEMGKIGSRVIRDAQVLEDFISDTEKLLEELKPVLTEMKEQNRQWDYERPDVTGNTRL